MQGDLIKYLLETEGASVVGVLLVGMLLLVLLYVRTDKKLDKSIEYNRDQDKQNLQILGELTNVLKDRKEHDNEVKHGVTSIKDTVKSNNVTLVQLNAMIQAKLLGMNN